MPNIFTKVSDLYSAARHKLFTFVHPAQMLIKPKSIVATGFHHPVPFWKLHLAFVTVGQQSNIRSSQFRFALNGSAISTPAISHIFPHTRSFDAAILREESAQLFDPRKQYIIHSCGHAEAYEQSLRARFQDIAEDGAIIIGFNPMGVGYSPGVTKGPEDYIAAIETIIEYLHHEKKIPYANIVLSGYSLGAAMSLLTAEKYLHKNIPLKVLADRSFTDLSKTAGWTAQQLITNKLLRYTIGIVFNLSVVGMFKLLNLNLNALTAFNAINNKYPGNAECFNVENDSIFGNANSLAHNVKGANSHYALKFEAFGNQKPSHFAHLENLVKRTPSGTELTNGSAWTSRILNSFKAKMDRDNKSPQPPEQTDDEDPIRPLLFRSLCTGIGIATATVAGLYVMDKLPSMPSVRKFKPS